MLWKILILCLISFVCSRNIDPRCTIPNSRPSQNLPHESNCSLFYKCHNGHLLQLPCPRGWSYHEESSSCVPGLSDECSNSASTSNLITIPTPPLIQTTSASSSAETTMASIETTRIIVPSAPTITTSTENPLNPDLIPNPTSSIVTIPTPATITASVSFMPTPPNINNTLTITTVIDLN